MTPLPPTMVRASVEEELDAAHALAGRHGWDLLWMPNDLCLRATTYHDPVSRLVEVKVEVDGYPAIPPAWSFVRPGTEESGAAFFPAPFPGSIFHGNVVICAPWNRLAYSEHGGPHNNWSGPTSWLQVAGVTQARTIPDMLAALDSHLRRSPGMMA